jgi:bacteriochlorophyllide a dehydrogenase
MANTGISSLAVVLEKPEHLVLSKLNLDAPSDTDIIVDVEWSGISTGTERLLWSGRMPTFPGMGYPLVPGYESIGRVSHAGEKSKTQVGQKVFVPGARCFGEVRGLFGGAAARLVVSEDRVHPIDPSLGEDGVLIALAATAYHAVQPDVHALPELIIGHGVLGRLIARITVAAGGSPVVWEKNPARKDGANGYSVVDPADDPRRDYKTICDVSGDSQIIDSLVQRLAKGGEIVLAGFYDERLAFAFPPAFMKEARIRIAAEWQRPDLAATVQLIEAGKLSLAGLITHRTPAANADAAYRTAFNDPACLKMILDWRGCQ